MPDLLILFDPKHIQGKKVQLRIHNKLSSPAEGVADIVSLKNYFGSSGLKALRKL